MCDGFRICQAQLSSRRQTSSDGRALWASLGTATLGGFSAGSLRWPEAAVRPAPVPPPPAPQGPPAAFPLLARVCVQLHDAGRSSRRVSTAPESETMRSGVGFGLSFQAPAHAFGVPLCLPPVVRPSSLVILSLGRQGLALNVRTATSQRPQPAPAVE